MDISKEKLLWMYEKMRLIREFEERLHVDFAAGKIPGFVHLYAGEEAVAVGVCANLTDADFITSTHRGHGHVIAKGGDIRRMMAEVMGRQDGYCFRAPGGAIFLSLPTWRGRPRISASVHTILRRRSRYPLSRASLSSSPSRRSSS